MYLYVFALVVFASSFRQEWMWFNPKSIDSFRALSFFLPSLVWQCVRIDLKSHLNGRTYQTVKFQDDLEKFRIRPIKDLYVKRCLV